MKGIKWVIGFFLVMFGLDIWSTLANGPLLQYLELNPVYHYAGIWGIIGINIFILSICWYSYNNTKYPFNAYMMMYLLVLISLMRIFIVYNNFSIAADPPTIEMARQMTTQMKQQILVETIIPQFLPYIIACVTFIMMGFDFDVIRKPEIDDDD